jgi:hypothetical protein
MGHLRTPVRSRAAATGLRLAAAAGLAQTGPRPGGPPSGRRPAGRRQSHRKRNQRNPVAAVGITEDGRGLLIIEVDGRQPRLSIGLTQPELASYLRWLGAYQAMVFNSGGRP